MWVKKSHLKIEQELEKERKEIAKKRFRNAFKIAIWAFIILLIVKIIISLTISVDFSPYKTSLRPAIRFQELYKYRIEILVPPIFYALIFFLIGLINPRIFKYKIKTLMCDKCFETKNPDTIRKCTCGGEYYKLNHYQSANTYNRNVTGH